MIRIFHGILCFLLSGVLSVAAVAGKPNIIVILADDLGYGDVAALNESSRIPTPNLDRLSRQGMTFTDAHTPSAVCTPTRYGLLTGRYCWRTRLKRGVLNGYAKPLMDADRKTIASVLKPAGYATGIVGKWHLGLGFARSHAGGGGNFDFAKPVTQAPNAYGFDFSYIIPASLDFPPYVYIADGILTAQPTEHQPAQPFPAYLRKGPRSPDLIMEDCLDHLTARAVAYIRDRASGKAPFFLYFPLTAPHKPVLPHPRFRGRSGLGPYGDFVVQMDATLGQVLQAVDAADIAQDTVVIFTSDNGSFMHRLDEPGAVDHLDDEKVQAYRADRHRANHIYRGTKADIWEAGHRVPFIVRWPAKVRPARSAKTICITDILATCAGIAGVTLDPETGQDSFSFLPELTGAGAEPRPPVIHHSAAGMFAIRSGKWKLVLGNGSGGRAKPRGIPFQKPWQLFDLQADPGEAHNVIDAHPDVASALATELERIRNHSHQPVPEAANQRQKPRSRR